MDTLTFILLFIIIFLLFLLIKKEKKIEPTSHVEKNLTKNTKPIDNNLYQKTLYKLLDYIPEQVIILDKSKEILFNNKSAKDRFQIKLKDNISYYLRNPDLLNAIEKSFEGENVKSFNVELRNPNVQRINVTLFYDNTNFFFNESVCLLFIRDLTEFYKFQQLKSDFVANVSHELRTPLQSIKMGLETIENNEKIKNDDELKNLFPIMLSQSERMENLIRDLLSLSKIELQEHIKPTHEIDLNNVINYVIETQKDLVKRKNIKINFSQIDDFNIIGDQDKLIEIFTNLIDNAVKYSNENTEINIIPSKDKSFNIIKIIDQGIGIPKQYIYRVTERFFTVDPSKSRSVGGTGLGLAIVKHLVSQHRGLMDISSEINKGTTVELKFKSL
jgi:two-component system, OmpR family, phosphate regulon sensor histidine kinase PhoR